MNFQQIVSTKQAADFFSPSPHNLGAPAADLHLLRSAHRREQLRMLEPAWLGFVCDSKHSLAYRVNEPSLDACGWHVALGHFDRSACYAWPTELQPLKDMPGFHAVRLLKAKEVAFCSVMDFDLVEAFSFQWRSWTWQRNIYRPRRRRHRLSYELSRTTRSCHS